MPSWYNEVMLMREFGWTEKQLVEEVTIERMQQIAYIYEIEAKKEKMGSGSHIPQRQIRKIR